MKIETKFNTTYKKFVVKVDNTYLGMFDSIHQANKYLLLAMGIDYTITPEEVK